MMRSAAALSLLLLFAGPAPAEESEEVPLGLIMPKNAELAKPGVKRGGPPRREMRPTADPEPERRPRGIEAARRDLIQDLRGRQKAGMAPKPDIDLVAVNLKLMLRADTSYLKHGRSWKRYPADKDFSRQARTARMRIASYVAKLGKKDVGEHGKGVVKALEDSLKRLARSMRTDLSAARRPPEPPPPGPDERRYLSAVSED